MNNYKDLETISSIISVGFAVIGGNIANNWLSNTELWKEGIQGEVLVLILILFVIVAIAQIFNIIIKRLINGSKWIRNILLGKQYLEGTWIDEVKHMGKTIGYGLVVISSDLDYIYMNGEDFSEIVEPQYPFEGRTNNIEWPKITFFFTGGQFSPSLQSFMIVHIHENSEGKPNHYTGVFTSQSHTKDEHMTHSCEIYSTEAWKIEDKNTIKKLNDPSNRIGTMKELIAKYFKENDKTNLSGST